MLYEIHITVKTDNTSAFVAVCKKIGVKPIIIDTIKGDNQIMTSSKHVGEDYISVLNRMKSNLEKQFEILRCKVEIKPELQKNAKFIYYESHLRLKLVKNKNYTELFNYCKQTSFHVSKNLFKKDAIFDYQMITYRDYNSSFEDFNKSIQIMIDYLSKNSIIYDKVEIEECVYDSNISVDTVWLS